MLMTLACEDLTGVRGMTESRIVANTGSSHASIISSADWVLVNMIVPVLGGEFPPPTCSNVHELMYLFHRL